MSKKQLVMKLYYRGENFLSEAGFNNVVFKSSKNEDLEFQKWITKKALSRIRQSGGLYSYSQDDDEAGVLFHHIRSFY